MVACTNLGSVQTSICRQASRMSISTVRHILANVSRDISARVQAFGREHPASTYLFFVLLALVVYFALWDNENYDTRKFLSVWIDYIENNGYWYALKDSFHNYTGPYITILTFFAWVGEGVLSDLHLIKLAPITGVLAVSALVYVFAKRHGADSIPPAIAAGSFLLLPTVVSNAAQWGQADIFYTGCVVVCLLFILKNKFFLSVLAFGLAVSFKLQAVFIGPFLLLIFLNRGVSLLYFAAVPAVYVIANGALLLAGRPFWDVALIYMGQTHYFKELAVGAPNPWYVLSRLILEIGYVTGNRTLKANLYTPLAVAGAIGGALVGLRFALLGLRRIKLTPSDIVVLAAFSAALMPYILPKMHNRYFYMADVLTFLLFIQRPRLWPIPLCFQIGSALVYADYFLDIRHLVLYGSAITATTVGIVALSVLVANIFAPDAPTLWGRMVKAYSIWRPPDASERRTS